MTGVKERAVPVGGMNGRPEHLEAALASGEELRNAPYHYVSLCGRIKPVEHNGIYRICVSCGCQCEAQVLREYQDGAKRAYCSVCTTGQLKVHVRSWLRNYNPPSPLAEDDEAVAEMVEMIEQFFEPHGLHVGTTARWG